MTPNSATLINRADRLYSDSGAEDVFDWIQSPISRQFFEQGNQVVGGIYMQVKPFEITLPAIDALAQEFAAWDAASDEALLNFEKENC
ncbi:MAG: hypothetical protein HYU84_03430 [Chloroflexi bacterium]|nr:hypothetical protein [Chloroflexota bacterium]MBI3169869.1 hypothetical protein [Chloroflexota bacterium]